MTCAGNQVDPGGLGPDFIGGVKNVTVPEGRDVILSCTVVRLGTHKVRRHKFSKFDFLIQSHSSKSPVCVSVLLLSSIVLPHVVQKGVPL